MVRENNSQDTSGTPGYMAPEVISHNNHSYPADYFALGVMGYEFMMGRRPYNGRNRKEIRENMFAKQAEIKIDELAYRWSPKAADFINQVINLIILASYKKSIKKARQQWNRRNKSSSLALRCRLEGHQTKNSHLSIYPFDYRGEL